MTEIVEWFDDAKTTGAVYIIVVTSFSDDGYAFPVYVFPCQKLVDMLANLNDDDDITVGDIYEVATRAVISREHIKDMQKTS